MGAAAGVRNGLGESATALQSEYLIAENRILRSHLPARLRLSDPERSTLAEIGKRRGCKGFQLIASVTLPVALPDAILAWYRRLRYPQRKRGATDKPNLRRNRVITPAGNGMSAA